MYLEQYLRIWDGASPLLARLFLILNLLTVSAVTWLLCIYFRLGPYRKYRNIVRSILAMLFRETSFLSSPLSWDHTCCSGFSDIIFH